MAKEKKKKERKKKKKNKLGLRNHLQLGGGQRKKSIADAASNGDFCVTSLAPGGAIQGRGELAVESTARVRDSKNHNPKKTHGAADIW